MSTIDKHTYAQLAMFVFVRTFTGVICLVLNAFAFACCMHDVLANLYKLHRLLHRMEITKNLDLGKQTKPGFSGPGQNECLQVKGAGQSVLSEACSQWWRCMVTSKFGKFRKIMEIFCIWFQFHNTKPVSMYKYLYLNCNAIVVVSEWEMRKVSPSI